MNISPYVTYIENRPLKIAYILNPRHKKYKKHLDAIISFNQTIWGGRYNPIVLSERQTIREDWWKILAEYDPDFIISIPKTSNAIISKIENHLSPLEMIVISNQTIERNNGLVSHLMPNPLPIMPTNQNLNKLSSPVIENPIYIDFDSQSSNNATLKRFLKYNFGENRTLKMHTFNNPPSNIKSYKIDDTSSLCKALEDIYNTLKYDNLIYPIQLCSLPNCFPDVDSDPIFNRFTITVGDSAYETVYHWNRCLRNSKQKRTSINDIWLPLSLAKNTKFQLALKKWLQTVVDNYSISAYQLQFVSYSLTTKELQDIANNFEIQGYSSNVSVYDRVQQPSFWQQAPFSNISKIKDFYSTTSRELNISVEQPDVNGVNEGGQWITDLYIKLPTKYRNILGKPYWLQLPRKNNIVKQLVNGKQTRVNSLGIPNTLLQTNDSIINIQIPYEKALLHKLLIEPNYPLSQYDLRHNKSIVTTKYNRYKISDKEMYLEGFLNFFHDLSEAYMNLTISFWRYVFDKLSKGASRNTQHLRDKIQRQINRNGLTSLGNDQGLDLLVDLVLKEAEIVRQNEDIIQIKNFTSYLVNDYKQYVGEISGLDKYYLDKEKIVNYVNGLLNRNILLLGIRPICPSCGSAFWYHIDETIQHLSCKGCQNNIEISAEETWYYKTNNLFKISVIQGTIPVVMVLGQLLRNCDNSFFYFPSIKLFEKRRKQPVAEIDIVCLQDGKFIIGEVKSKLRNFNPHEFDKIEKIARKIKPDKVIFSCLENQQPNRHIERLITNLQNNLADLAIEVSWFPLDDF